MIISLTGFMGSGKTSVGKELSDLLGWDFIDLDNYMEAKTGRSIPSLLSDGEDYFRATEAEAVRDIITMREIAPSDLVLALGGGTMTIAPLTPLILEKTRCIHLRASLDEICKRLSKDIVQRPLLPENPADVQSLMESRTSSYAMAGKTLDTDGISPREAAIQIRDLLF